MLKLAVRDEKRSWGGGGRSVNLAQEPLQFSSPFPSLASPTICRQFQRNKWSKSILLPFPPSPSAPPLQLSSVRLIQPPNMPIWQSLLHHVLRSCTAPISYWRNFCLLVPSTEPNDLFGSSELPELFPISADLEVKRGSCWLRDKLQPAPSFFLLPACLLPSFLSSCLP